MRKGRFKFATTLFLGIGIASVLQGRLIPDEAGFAITESARNKWETADVVGTGTMLILIAAGELVAVRATVAGHASSGDHDLVVVLLFVTAGYVIVQSLVKRGLSCAWRWSSAAPSQPEYQPDGVRRFIFGLIIGVVLGGAVFISILLREWQLLFSSILAVFARLFITPIVPDQDHTEE